MSASGAASPSAVLPLVLLLLFMTASKRSSSWVAMLASYSCWLSCSKVRPGVTYAVVTEGHKGQEEAPMSAASAA